MAIYITIMNPIQEVLVVVKLELMEMLDTVEHKLPQELAMKKRMQIG